MKRLKYTLVFLLMFMAQFLMACAVSGAAPVCNSPGTNAMQVLGSGGPIADDDRASSAYLVWVDGKARVLIDAGSGSFLRFGESGAKFSDLLFVGLSHFHTDHSADFPALLKTGYFESSRAPITVSGPGGNQRFPGLEDYLERTISDASGSYAYLSDYLGDSGRVRSIQPIEVNVNDAAVSRVYENSSYNITIDALPVPHGIVPALAFRVSIGDDSIVFTSDQNGSTENLAAFAEGASILVTHLVIPETADVGARSLHSTPSQIARLANDSRPSTLVLSHFMARSLRDPSIAADIVRAKYDGSIHLAKDLDCLPFRPN
jgi:ribonuclease BN (tRNA processing enzyme)